MIHIKLNGLNVCICHCFLVNLYYENRADTEFYREMIEHFQAESASKSALVRTLQTEISALREENRSMCESHREDIERPQVSHREDMEKLRKSYEKMIAAMQSSFDHDPTVWLRPTPGSRSSSATRLPPGSSRVERSTDVPRSSGTSSTTAGIRTVVRRTDPTAYRRWLMSAVRLRTQA